MRQFFRRLWWADDPSDNAYLFGYAIAVCLTLGALWTLVWLETGSNALGAAAAVATLYAGRHT